jgi:regulator of sigma E protease
MEFLIKAAQLILSLSILVILHEFGHYFPARLFKTRVEKFYLFFNPWFSLFKKKVGDTEWGIGWLPLGGFVKIAGMVDESMDKEQLALPPQPWEFRSKPAWQRLIIMLGGVTVNVITAMVIYICLVFAYGEEKLAPKELKKGMAIHPYLEKYGLNSGDNILRIDGQEVFNVKDLNNEIMLRGKRKLEVVRANGSKEIITLPKDIEYELFEKGAFPAFDLRSTCLKIDTVLAKKDSPAYIAGLKDGDRILSVNGQVPDFYDDVKSQIYQSRGASAEFTVLREKDTVHLRVKVPEIAIIGFNVLSSKEDIVDFHKIKTEYYGFGACLGKGIHRGYLTLSDYASQLKFLFSKKGVSELGGFARIGQLFPSIWNWQAFWITTAFISMALAFMNILPIPALDGGHVVFLIYEMVTGREAPQKVLEYAQYVGFFILIGLTLYANGNDIFKWITG